MTKPAAQKDQLIATLATCFRRHGYEGASLSRITEATGLGRGSLYHAFPGGKDEMLRAVLTEIDQWFEHQIFQPLLTPSDDPKSALSAMFFSVDRYFQSGQTLCLMGVLALSDMDDPFRAAIRSYFQRWLAALVATLSPLTPSPFEMAQQVLSGIQGAILLGRALDDPSIFPKELSRLKRMCGLI